MRLFLPLLSFLCPAAVRGIFEGACLRKEPPPGVLVLSPGSRLSVTCNGDVRVNDVKVDITRSGSNRNTRGTSAHAVPTTAKVISNTGVSAKRGKQTVEHGGSELYHTNPTEAGENRKLGHTDTGFTASPTTQVVSTLVKVTVTDGEDDDEEEEEEGREGNRVTRGIKSRFQWMRNERKVGKGDGDWGRIVFEDRGAKLSLSSVRPTDSGRYTCSYRDRERFAIKVIVADPPERPHLSCFKRSPISKIRCEWEPQRPVTLLPTCHLLLRKGLTATLLQFNCSYSARRSRFWCALDYVEDDRRVPHMAYLCVTSVAGNTTSELLHFTPFSILKPDPPSDVKVLPIEGQETKLMVTWHTPLSWKPQQNFYHLKYELKYKPLISPYDHYQVVSLDNAHHSIIEDAMPGVEYTVQVRAKEQYEGQWSVWSTPVCNSSWIAPTTDLLPTEDLTTLMEGSGTDAPDECGDVDDHVTEALWISLPFAALSIVLAAYIFRHKDRFTSKLHSLSAVTRCGDPHPPMPPPPPAPTAPEAQALVTQAPARYREPPPSEVEEREDREEDNEEDQAEDRTETMHFNNTSYFFLQRQ